MENGNAWNASFSLGLKRQNVWGWAHASEFFALGLGGTLVLDRVLFGVGIGRLGGLNGSYLLGVLLVGTGGLVLVADLGKPRRFLRAAANLRHSWISWGVVADGIFLAGGLVLLLAGGPAWVAWLTGTAALFVVVYPGFALTASPSIPFWNTSLVPLVFLGQGFACAAALAAWLDPAGAVAPRLAAVCFALAITFTVLHLAGAYMRRGVARTSARELLRGIAFPLVVLLGLALPLALSLAASGAGHVSSSAWAGATLLALGGNWAAKYFVLRAGYYAPLF